MPVEYQEEKIGECLRQVQEIATSCFRKKAESSNHRESAMDSFASALQVIDNQPLSLDRFRQQNCVLFTPVQSLHEGVSPKVERADLQPSRGSQKPRANLCRRVAILKFLEGR